MYNEVIFNVQFSANLKGMRKTVLYLTNEVTIMEAEGIKIESEHKIHKGTL